MLALCILAASVVAENRHVGKSGVCKVQKHFGVQMVLYPHDEGQFSQDLLRLLRMNVSPSLFWPCGGVKINSVDKANFFHSRPDCKYFRLSAP